jgi:predicted NBD/HSP70 family sugar kinase
MLGAKNPLHVGVLCIEDDFISFELQQKIGSRSKVEMLDHARLPVGSGDRWFQVADLKNIPAMILDRYKKYVPLDLLSISIFEGVDSNRNLIRSVPRKDLDFKLRVYLSDIFEKVVKPKDPKNGDKNERIIANNDTVTMALGHATSDSETIAYVHFGRGVGCGITHGLNKVNLNGRHSEFGHLRARMDPMDRMALTLADGTMLSNCRSHGGEEDEKKSDQTPCYDGLLARSTLNKLPTSINKYEYFIRYSSQLLAVVALAGAPNIIYIGGSSLKLVSSDLEKTLEDILRQFEWEVAGYPGFPRTAFEHKRGTYVQLSDWSNSADSLGVETAAQKGAALLGWRALKDLAKKRSR